MNVRGLLRNRLTGFIFGKYDIETEANQYLITEEEYISGIEIIHYDELIYLFSFLLFVIGLLLGFVVNTYFLILTIFPIYLLFLATELELIILTDERVLIEKRGWFEKLLNTTNIQAINMDQIAVISYARAPFQLPSILIGLILMAGSVISFIFIENYLFILLVAQITVLIPFATYLIYFGLRLNKRSIELYVIGVRHPIGIGRKKGAVVWFLEELQNIVFERVHHAFHSTEEHTEIQISEFPLEYSGSVKQLIDQTRNQLEKKILVILDKQNTPKKVIYNEINEATREEIDFTMRQLRRNNLIFYSRSQNVWCLNRQYIHGLSTNPQDSAEE